MADTLDPYLGRKILITLAGMLLGYGLLALSQFPDYGPPAVYALAGLGVLLLLAFTTVRWIVDFIIEWMITTPDSIFFTLLLWLIGILSVIVLMPVALLIMVVRYWQAKRKAAQAAGGQAD